MTPYDSHVLGGTRAQDELLDAELPEPVEHERFRWPHVMFLAGCAFLLGTVTWNLAVA